MLMALGAKHVESPFIELGQVCTVVYFSYFVFMVLILSLLENTFLDLSLYNSPSSKDFGSSRAKFF